MKVKSSYANQPSWKNITVKSHLPSKLQKLDELAHNLWGSWNQPCRDLFKNLDPDLYKEVNRNPVDFLYRMDYDALKELAEDPEVIARMDKVYSSFRKYMDVAPDSKRPSVAYFCMEYGMHHSLNIYSGGLGILAGDYMKEASDSNVDMCGIGLLYRYGYFTQTLSMDGQQIANYEPQDFDRLAIVRELDENGNQVFVDVPFPGRTIHVAVYRVNVGRVKLYLMDTDNIHNEEGDRTITHSLYGGDWENRIKQEYLLGIGGMLMLKKLGIKKDIYHCNEGHAALCNVQRLCDYVESGMNFGEALELVRSSSLYTVHTPVPAGHDYFEEGLFSRYLGGYQDRLGISWDDFMGLGRTNPDDKGEKFCMSTFCCKTCQEVNGVSYLHQNVSREMFSGIWEGYYPKESHVGYVTNGVHLPTWCSKEFMAVYKKYFDKQFLSDQSNPEIWEAIYRVPDEVVWKTRIALKEKLARFIRARFRESWLKNQGDPSRVVSLLDKINPNALIIGFARRFATYKRAHLLFSDLDRLSKIVNNPDYPVQFIFAGKAHPADGAGQGLIKRIYEISQSPEFLGKIIFLENYDIQLARRLVSGVDIWMNTPTRPLEASGTSGEKALMNGVVNLSVLDGWWYEGYREGAGWALTDKRTYQNQEIQDKLDASTIYSMLEQEIIPLYYARGTKGYSDGWVRVVKNSIANIAPHYTMKRQLDDYFTKFYVPQAERFHIINADNAKIARELAAWKEQVASVWEDIKVVSSEKSESIQDGTIVSGTDFTVKHVIDEAGLENAIGVDMVVVSTANGQDSLYKVFPMNLVAQEGSLHTFECKLAMDLAGTFRVAYRMYPKHKHLPHRQDFAYVRWFS